MKIRNFSAIKKTTNKLYIKIKVRTFAKKIVQKK